MRVHFIAIGGAIMHNLAIALDKKGFIVTGSDDQIYEPSRTHLKTHGLMPSALGWDPARVTDELDAVILGKQADADNPELKRAQELGIRIYSYPEFIYEQAREKVRVVVSGSHGKTTITSMIMHVLQHAGRDFDYLVGAKLEGFDAMVKLTKDAPLMIIEGDEYPTSAIDKQPKFLHYHPNIGVISGVAWDHFDAFPTFEKYIEQFKLFIQSIEPKGTLVFNREEEVLRELVMADHSKINKHGYSRPAYTINKGITYMQTGTSEVPLQVFGKHNLSNVAAAFTVCEWLGISRASFYEAITSYKNASRRLEYVTRRGDSVVYQDFVHTPAKLKASIHAVKEQFGDRELVALIELHVQLSLNSEYLNEYRDSMQEADYPVVFIDGKSLKQVNTALIGRQALLEAFNSDELLYFTDLEALEKFFEGIDPAGKNLLFMNSGGHDSINVSKFIDKFFWR